MKPASLVTAGALALATAVLTIVPVVPAMAAELPSSDRLYTIASTDQDNFQLFSVDPDDAFATPIGAGLDELPDAEYLVEVYASGASRLPGTNLAYFIANLRYEDGPDYTELETWLGHVDLTTGEIGLVGEFDEEYGYDRVTALTIGADGTAFAFAGPSSNEESTDFYLFQADLDDAQLWVVGEPEEPTPRMLAFTYGAETGQYFAVDDSNVGYLVDVTTGAVGVGGLLDVGGLSSGPEWIVALQTDSGNSAWFDVWTDAGTVLAHISEGDSVPSPVGEFRYDDFGDIEDLETYSLVVGPSYDTTRTTATGGKLFVFGDDVNYNGLQLFRVDPDTGFALPVGTGTGEPNGEDGTWYTAEQPAYDPVTKKVYFVENTGAFPDGERYYLDSLDPATGEATRIGEFESDGDTDVEINAFAIGSDGSAFAFAWTEASSAYLYSVNLATAELEPVWESPYEFITYAFAADPVSGRFYALDVYSGALFEVNVSPDAEQDERLEFLALVQTESTDGDGDGATGMQIDGNGTFWIMNTSYIDPDGPGPVEESDWFYLNSFSLDDAEGEEPPIIEATQHGLLTDDPLSAAGLLLLPTAAAAGPGGLLAITGADSDAGVAAAILLLLAGGGLVLLRRRRAATR